MKSRWSNLFIAEQWEEIFLTIRRHKLRSFLSGFGVFWGIFMLLILLGTGDGIRNGIYSQFRGYTYNCFFVWGGKTSIPYQGMNPGRHVRLTSQDLALIKENIEGIEYINGTANLRTEFAINFRENSSSFPIIGNLPDLMKIENISIIKGRFINVLDCRDNRRIAVIGRRVQTVLFGDIEPIGKTIEISGVHFKVVGVFDSEKDLGSERDPTEYIHVPLPVLQQIFNMGNQVHWIGALVRADMDAAIIEKKTARFLKNRHKVSPIDRRGVRFWNTVEKYRKTVNLLKGINILIWIVGIGSITAGIVGVSNIMFIVVKEKTQEIGIRKAIGATPFSIVSLILKESILITMISGYLGLISGVVVIELINYLMERHNIQSAFFQNPQINFKAALLALALLVVSGVLAGLAPGHRAASVNPIEALKSE